MDRRRATTFSAIDQFGKRPVEESVNFKIFCSPIVNCAARGSTSEKKLLCSALRALIRPPMRYFIKCCESADWLIWSFNAANDNPCSLAARRHNIRRRCLFAYTLSIRAISGAFASSFASATTATAKRPSALGRWAVERWTRLQTHLAEYDGGWAEIGKGGLEHICPDEGSQKKPIGANQPGKREAEQHQGAS
jgi:hypothetical protein